MPKKKKPAGGRPAKNFDPRYNPKYRSAKDAGRTRDDEPKRRPGEASAGKPGSRSPGHRGYRQGQTAPEASGREGSGSGSPKRRWSEQERVGRDEARAIRTHARDGRADSAPRKPPREPDRGRRDTRRPGTLPAAPQRLEAQSVAPGDLAGATFGDLGLGQNIVKALDELGARHPFAIQAATIPPILEGRDVLARGRTGSGKTIAFGAPLVESVLRSQAGQKREIGRAPRALILAPTRELALQIDATIQPIARSVGLYTTQIYGGVSHGRQLGALKKGIDIVIGTPGRIEDLVEQRALDLSAIRVIVLDEADHMAELGFVEAVQRLLRRTPRRSQKLLYSATLDREVEALVTEFLSDPAVYEVAGETQATAAIDHRVLVVDHRDKAEILRTLVDRPGKTLVFSRTRAYAEMLAEQFEQAGVRALALHGDLDQARRTRNLERLTSGKVGVLVATDVAARGIHVDDIDLVVQADPPDEFKAYLHRAGRTGRAGRAGTVVTLVTRQRRARLAELLERAEIEAPFDEARPGDPILDELRAPR
ncbi:DEAD/DEAH box helicase [Microbacterium cremeum]|uniref:DEAD/DEAH box helicase n=1 Tax=Microbacterium cremeum TaxID=2782169 RepID=UPI0018872391|nr:DEAD/DEAH box helicase [Microbacterium cremeum]